jgi:PKD repeat protein
VWFSGASPGGLTATSQGLYYSSDAGASWAQVIDEPVSGAVAGFSKGFAAGSHQVFRATPPNAETPWTPVFELPDSAQTSCFDLRGFSVEDASLGGANGVYKRIADEVWEWQPSSQGYLVGALFFLNNQTGYALSENGILLKTENAGGPTLPYVDFEFQTTGCLGDTVVFRHKGFSGNTYQWSVNDSLIAGAGDSLVWHFDKPGVYEITLTGSNSELSNTYTRQVVITPFPDTALPVYAQQDTLCLGDEVVIIIENSQSGIAYTLYQQPDDIPVDTFSAPGGTIWLSGGNTQADALYTVSAQNLESGCLIELQDTAHISLALPTEGINYPAVTICPGDNIQLSARAGLVYAWQPAGLVSDPEVQQPLAFPLDTSTLFTVTILPPYCPAFTDSVQISISFPAIPAITLTGDSLYAHPVGAVAYEWYYNEQLVAETADPVLLLLGEGSYEVISIDSFGCRSESSPVIVVLISVSRPGDGSFEVYPNPSNGRMAFVLTNGNQPKHIRFFDSLGRLLYTAKWSDGAIRIEVILPDTFPGGAYYWQAEGEGWLRRGKGIKK